MGAEIWMWYMPNKEDIVPELLQHLVLLPGILFLFNFIGIYFVNYYFSIEVYCNLLPVGKIMIMKLFCSA